MSNQTHISRFNLNKLRDKFSWVYLVWHFLIAGSLFFGLLFLQFTEGTLPNKGLKSIIGEEGWNYYSLFLDFSTKLSYVWLTYLYYKLYTAVDEKIEQWLNLIGFTTMIFGLKIFFETTLINIHTAKLMEQVQEEIAAVAI